MKPMEELRMEHEAVKLTLKVLEKMCQKMEQPGDVDDTDHVNQLLEFFSVFVGKCHHGKEEELLFPALEQVGVTREGGLIGVLLKEHQQGLEYVQKMKTAISGCRAGEPGAAVNFIGNAREYIALLDQHIDKENNVLFPLAEKQLSDAKQTELFYGFEKIESEKIGVGRHEQFHGMLDNLKSAYLK